MNPIATWIIELRADCPQCNCGYVDLLDYVDFWDGRRLEIGEHGTDRSRDVDVICPECSHEFTVDLEY